MKNNKTQNPSLIPIIAALDGVWAQIRERFEGVPAVVITIADGTGRRHNFASRFRPAQWTDFTRDKQVKNHEVIIAGEALESADNLLSCLLHEAVHARNAELSIQDCSNNYRYHNATYAKTAKEVFGLAVMEKAADITGFDQVVAPESLRSLFDLSGLSNALGLYRITDNDNSKPKKKKTNKYVTITCDCAEPHKIRVKETDLTPAETGENVNECLYVFCPVCEVFYHTTAPSSNDKASA